MRRSFQSLTMAENDTVQLLLTEASLALAALRAVNTPARAVVFLRALGYELPPGVVGPALPQVAASAGALASAARQLADADGAAALADAVTAMLGRVEATVSAIRTLHAELQSAGGIDPAPGRVPAPPHGFSAPRLPRTASSAAARHAAPAGSHRVRARAKARRVVARRALGPVRAIRAGTVAHCRRRVPLEHRVRRGRIPGAPAQGDARCAPPGRPLSAGRRLPRGARQHRGGRSGTAVSDLPEGILGRDVRPVRNHVRARRRTGAEEEGPRAAPLPDGDLDLRLRRVRSRAARLRVHRRHPRRGPASCARRSPSTRC